MLDKIKALLEQTEQYAISKTDELEQFRLKFLSKKGEIALLFNDFKNVPAELKKEVVDNYFLWVIIALLIG